jgi:hypothetical protein
MGGFAVCWMDLYVGSSGGTEQCSCKCVGERRDGISGFEMGDPRTGVGGLPGLAGM